MNDEQPNTLSNRYGKEADLDLGDNHFLWFSCWRPDRALNPQYANLPDLEKAGATVQHLTPQGEICASGITFDLPGMREAFGGHSMWQVVQWEPLTLSPSLLCRACDDHGFIREGRWVKA